MNPFDQFDQPSAANPFDQFDAPAQAAPQAAPDQSWGAYANNLVRKAANSVPVIGGLADKMDAATAAALQPYLGTGMDGASFSDRYAKDMAAQQGNDLAFEQQNPKAAMAAGLAGGVGGTVALTPNALLGMSGTLPTRLGLGALGGTATGAADSAVRGDDPLSGAELGFATGLAGPAIGAGVGAGARAVAGALAEGGALQGVGDAVRGLTVRPAVAPRIEPTFGNAPTLPAPPVDPLAGVDPTGRQMLAKILAGETPDTIMAAQQKVGPQGFLSDINRNGTDLAGSIYSKPGAPSGVIKDAYGARDASTNDRLAAMLNGQLGPAQSPLQFSQGLKDQGGQIAAGLPEILRNAPPVDISPVVQQLDAGAKSAVGPEASAISQAKSWLTKEKPAPQWEMDPLGPSSIPEAPADMTFGPTDNGVRGAAPSRPGMPKAQSLHDFVKSLGGVQDPHGDLTSMGLADIPGLVARSGKGLGPDAVRQVAAEAGYLGPHIDDAMANTSINDLYDALSSEHPVYSVRDQGALDEWNRYAVARDAWEQQGKPNSRPAAPQSVPASAYADMLAPKSQIVAVDHAPTLHNAKTALDNTIRYGNPGLGIDKSAVASAQGAFKQARGGVNAALREQVPGYAGTMDQLSALNRQRQAVQSGTEALGAGKQAIRPDDFAQQWAAMSPEEQQAFRVGMRGNVDQALGTRANDLVALKGITQGENGWNQQKLGTAFGQDAATGINDAIDRENFYKAQKQDVTGGSPTNKNQERRALSEPDRDGGAIGYWHNLSVHRPATWVPDAVKPENLVERFQAGRYAAAREQVAPLLVSHGEKRDALIEAMMAAQQRKMAAQLAARSSAQPVDPLITAMIAAQGRHR